MENLENELCEQPINVLLQFPNEVTYSLLNAMEVEVLANLALTSKAVMTLILQFIESNTGLNKIRIMWQKCNLETSADANLAYKLGIFFRRIFMFGTCTAKMRKVTTLLTKAICPWGHSDIHQKINFQILFYLLQELLRGESDKNLFRAHSILQEVSRMEKLVLKVLASKPGSMPEKEILVRDYYKLLYFNQIPPNYWCFGVQLLFQKLSYFYQAKFILLLFLPVQDGIILWSAFTRPSNQTFTATKSSSLQDLGRFLKTLKESSILSSEKMMLLGFEMMAYPSIWFPQFRCRLIIECGEDFAKHLVITN